MSLVDCFVCQACNNATEHDANHRCLVCEHINEKDRKPMTPPREPLDVLRIEREGWLAIRQERDQFRRQLSGPPSMSELQAKCDSLEKEIGDLGAERDAALAVTGETSDGYHTFNELYDHRITLFIALMRATGIGWRSKVHANGTMFDGWFIAGMFVASGQQITYHLPISRWGETDFLATILRAPEWDGHTPGDVLQRIKVLNRSGQKGAV